MGIFSNVSNFVEKKLKDRNERKKEEQEIATIRHKALHEERIKAAPSLAKKQAALEVNQKIANIKTGKGSGGLNFGNIQNLAHDIGQSTGSQFNNDFNNMFSGSGGKRQTKISGSIMGPPNAFTDEYDRTFGRPAPKTQVHKKGGKGKTIIIKV